MDGTKTVTRRLGWLHAKPGQQVRPVRKCMGLRPGEKLDVLRDPLTIVGVRREPLRTMLDDLDYGLRECSLEGFGAHPDYRWPSAFVAMFCETHKGCTPDTVITRLEFVYHQGQCSGDLDGHMVRPGMVVYRHTKSGGLYGIECHAKREHDGVLLVVYRNLATGDVWARPADEFNDGRFERVA